ncbi:MAG: sulfatase family protein [Isosphaeraceae bacterium]
MKSLAQGCYRQYHAGVTSVDRNIGRLLDRIDALGLSKRIIVIFSSDRGYMIGHHGPWHKGNAGWLVEGKKGYRPNMFEKSIRVPLLIRWPGVVSGGTVIDHVVANIDLFPTILDMARIGVAANPRPHGRSLMPLLRNANAPWDDTLCGQYDMHHYQVARMRMFRTPQWKLIRHFEPGGRDEILSPGCRPRRDHEPGRLARSPEPDRAAKAGAPAGGLDEGDSRSALDGQ